MKKLILLFKMSLIAFFFGCNSDVMVEEKATPVSIDGGIVFTEENKPQGIDDVRELLKLDLNYFHTDSIE